MSPLLRRLLESHGLDESEVRGTGPGFRVTRADVLAAVAAKQNGVRRNGDTPARAIAEPEALETSREPAPAASRMPVAQIEHHEAWQGLAPHGLCATDVDLERVERLLRLHNGRRPDLPAHRQRCIPRRFKDE